MSPCLFVDFVYKKTITTTTTIITTTTNNDYKYSFNRVQFG